MVTPARAARGRRHARDVNWARYRGRRRGDDRTIRLWFDTDSAWCDHRSVHEPLRNPQLCQQLPLATDTGSHRFLRRMPNSLRQRPIVLDHSTWCRSPGFGFQCATSPVARSPTCRSRCCEGAGSASYAGCPLGHGDKVTARGPWSDHEVMLRSPMTTHRPASRCRTGAGRFHLLWISLAVGWYLRYGLS